jgi:arylsulfatase A-like enzyme
MLYSQNLRKHGAGDSDNRRARPLFLAIVAGATIACSPGTQRPQTKLSQRLLPEGDYRAAKAAVFYREVEVARWEFATAEDVAAWTPENIDTTFEIARNGLFIQSTSPDPMLSRDVNLDAGQIDAIRVTMSGLTSDAYVQVYWAAQGAPFEQARSMGCATKDASGDLVPSYTFRLHEHSEWSGPIGRIRLDPTSVADRRLLLHSVVALDLDPSSDLLASLNNSLWRFDIRGDVRSAVLAPPGIPFVRELAVPEQAVLRFARGLDPGIDTPVTFRVAVDSPDGPRRVLDETVIEPCAGSADCRWHEATLPLGELADHEARLVFETETSTPLDLFRGFPAWANIEIARPRASPPPPNIVMIVIDTLRADRLSLYGYGRETSPHLDAWARRCGVVFDTVVAPAPWTLPSHVSIFTGLDALTHGVNTGDPMPPSLESLAEILRRNDYVTHAITGGAYVSDSYGVMQGFDSYSYYYPPCVDPTEAGNDIETGVKNALEWLESTTDRPFFLFFHTYETHTPYRAREPFFSRFRPAGTQSLIPPVETLAIPPVRENGYQMSAALQARFLDPVNPMERVPADAFDVVNDLYDSGVAFADSQVIRIVDCLRRLGIDRSTVVVVTSDHGECLGERGRADHKSLEEWELLVPLIVAGPGLEERAGSRVTAQARLIDIMPTLLELLGIEARPGLDGQSLLPLVFDSSSPHPQDAWSYASSSNFGVSLRRANNLKYIFNNCAWPPIHGDEELYQLDSDPHTEHNLAGGTAEVATLRSQAHEEYVRRTSGLRILFSNHLDRPIEAHLKGPIVEPLRIKAFNVGEAFIEWRYQMVNLSVPAGASSQLFVEGIPFGELYVTASIGNPGDHRSRFKQVLRLEGLQEAFQMVLKDGRWRPDTEADLTTSTGIRAWIHGDLPSAGAPSAIDERSRELLRKLGYLQ